MPAPLASCLLWGEKRHWTLFARMGIGGGATPFSRVCTEWEKNVKNLWCIDVCFFLHNISLLFIVHEIVAVVQPLPWHVPEMAQLHLLRCAGLTTHLHSSRALAAQERPGLAGAKWRLLLQTSPSISFTFRTKLLHSSLAASADPSPC